MGSLANNSSIVQPALGQDIQLGMLYDARTSQFFGGISLWDNAVVNAKQELNPEQVQNADFVFSYSLEEARKNSSLDVEGSLSLDLKLLSVTGSAKYLDDKKSTTHEARLDASCTVVRRTRRIPQEVLASMKYGKYLDDARFTHFVAEVVEGGSATLSFVRACSSSEEAKRITGELKVSIVKIPVSGSAKVDFSDKNESLFESVKISYSGAIAENVSNLDDARRVAAEMPKKLASQMNTLSYKLLPLSLLDSKAGRIVRSLDTVLVNKVADALKAGTTTSIKLKELLDQELYQKQFPAIRRQISNFQAAFSVAENEYAQEARRLLPELRDGTTDANTKITDLRKAVDLFQQRTATAEEFIRLKSLEANVLQISLDALFADKFENHLDGLKPQSLTGGAPPRLLLSFGGLSIGIGKHPLQASIESAPGQAQEDSGAAEPDSEDQEWFEDQENVSRVTQSCSALRQLRLLPPKKGSVVFGVASIEHAFRPGNQKRAKTRVGDVVLDDQGKLSIVTSMLPKAPAAPVLCVEGQTITVALAPGREDLEGQIMPTNGMLIKYRRRRNPARDGAFPQATENEPSTEASCDASKKQIVLSSLSDDCDYEVAVSVQTIVGASPWSPATVERTPKKPSVASEMIDFFEKNRSKLSEGLSNVVLGPNSMPTKKPWDLQAPKNGSSKKTLFLGLTEVANRKVKDTNSEDKVAVRIVDVASEFKPDVKASDVEDKENTIVAVFSGTSGHGKSTQINAFISFLLGGDLQDKYRILVIDDRGAPQSGSVTQVVTCFRIRPLSPGFQNKTLLIVDTPGYADSRGVKGDAFVTTAMSEFFQTVNHVNAIIFTCKANEVRNTFLRPVSTYIFRLFAKNVQNCLRTIFTFGDAGQPIALTTLKELGWPVENGYVKVNNSAFTVELDGTQNDEVVRDTWTQSMKGQFQILQMLLRATSITTSESSEVTLRRITLEQKCELAETKIYRTSNDAGNLISKLDALADAVGASPGQKITVFNKVVSQIPVENGNYTTLCLDCNMTCHEICGFADDADKINCIAMQDGSCTICPKHCKWDRHKNASFILRVDTVAQDIVPEELLKTWSDNNNTLEGALLDAMDTYLKLQEELRTDLLFLADLSATLTKTALRDDPASLINYVDWLINGVKTHGADPDQLVQLSTARNTLLLANEINTKGTEATRDSKVLLDIFGSVREEMSRRKELSVHERAKEEEKPCTLYNNLREKVPSEIKKKAPGLLAGDSRYPQNLKAVIRLISAVLKDGGVVAAIVTSKEGKNTSGKDT